MSRLLDRWKTSCDRFPEDHLTERMSQSGDGVLSQSQLVIIAVSVCIFYMLQELLSSEGVFGFSGAFACFETVAKDVSRQQTGQKKRVPLYLTQQRGSRAEWTYPKDTGQAKPESSY